MSTLKEHITRYLNDDSYYTSKKEALNYKRRGKNYFCRRYNGNPVPLKEIGDLYSMFDNYPNDHTDHMLSQLLELGIPVYAKRIYESTVSKFKWAIDKNLLVFED